MSVPTPAQFINSTLGTVWPPRAPQPLSSKDARTHALERFKLFISLLQFQREGAPGQPPIPFFLPLDNIHLAQPDDIADLHMPGIGIIPARGTNDAFNLGPPIIQEDTVDKFGPGTAVVRSSTYEETFILEVWAEKIAERVCLIAGLKEAMRLGDTSYSIRLTLPDYFGLVAQFALADSQYIDGDEVSRNRRRGHIFINLQVCEVFLTNVTPFRADVHTTILDGMLGSGVDC